MEALQAKMVGDGNSSMAHRIGCLDHFGRRRDAIHFGKFGMHVKFDTLFRLIIVQAIIDFNKFNMVRFKDVIVRKGIKMVIAIKDGIPALFIFL